jgi:hypothetical protein
VNWEEYGEGFRCRTEFGTYTIGSARSGWWCSFHCLCCRQFSKVVPMDSQLDRCKAKATEHRDGLAKRYQEVIHARD